MSSRSEMSHHKYSWQKSVSNFGPLVHSWTSEAFQWKIARGNRLLQKNIAFWNFFFLNFWCFGAFSLNFFQEKNRLLTKPLSWEFLSKIQTFIAIIIFNYKTLTVNIGIQKVQFSIGSDSKSVQFSLKLSFEPNANNAFIYEIPTKKL